MPGQDERDVLIVPGEEMGDLVFAYLTLRYVIDPMLAVQENSQWRTSPAGAMMENGVAYDAPAMASAGVGVS